MLSPLRKIAYAAAIVRTVALGGALALITCSVRADDGCILYNAIGGCIFGDRWHRSPEHVRYAIDHGIIPAPAPSVVAGNALDIPSSLVKNGPPAVVSRPGAAVDMTIVLVNARGEALRDFDQRKGNDDVRCENCPVLTLGHAIYYSLLATWKDEPADWKEMWSRAKLAERVRDEKEAVLTAEEVSKILPLLAKAFGALVISQAVPILDPNAK